MDKKLNEFINADGKLIHSGVPITNPLIVSKSITDKSVRARTQPFLYTVYRRFFSENELPYSKDADKMSDDPERFHKYLIEKGEGDKFADYFQKDDNSPTQKLKEISREKAYNVLETITSRSSNDDIFQKGDLPTIEEIRGKEILLVDKLDKIANTIRDIMDENEKKVLLSYFAKKIKHG